MEVSQANTSDQMMSFWMQFFKDAGILASDVENYSIAFVNHRIQKHMLADLNKEYLVEMGITAMGDIIAILGQAKAVQSKPLREVARTMQATSTNTSSATETPLQRLEKAISASQLSSQTVSESRLAKRSSVASRIVGHYLGNDPEARPLIETAQETKLPSVELSKFPRSSTPDSVSRKTSVFNRLGTNSPTARNSPVHSRLNNGEKLANFKITVGGTTNNLSKTTDLREVLKRPATTTSHNTDDSDVDNSDCEYGGVLKKSGGVPKNSKKRIKLSTTVAKKSAGQMSSSRATEGILGAETAAEKLSVKERLGLRTASDRSKR